MDRGNAPHAALGTLRIDLHAGTAMVVGGHCNLSNCIGRGVVCGDICRPPHCDDAANRFLGAEAAGSVVEFGPDPGMGRNGFRDLVGKLYEEHDSLARSRLLHPGWRTGSRGHRRCWKLSRSSAGPETITPDSVS